MENIQTKICQFDLFRGKEKISQKRNIFLSILNYIAFIIILHNSEYTI